MWQTIRLGDVCTISSSKRIFAKEYQTEGIPFYRGKEVIEKHNGNKVSTELFISPKRYEEIKGKYEVPKKGDILLTSVGTLGIPWLVDEDDFYFKDGNLTWLRCNTQILPSYLYLWLNSAEAQNQIDVKCIGSTQKALTIETLNKFQITLPSLELQKKIVAVINPIESRININRSVNENLEQQTKALYQSWFVDYLPFEGIIPEGWHKGTLSDLADAIICGKTPSTKHSEYYGNEVPFITIPDMHNQIYAVSTARSLSTVGVASQSGKMLPRNSTCVSCIGTAGLVCMVAEPSQTNQQINSIVPSPDVSPYYIYLLAKTLSDTIQNLGSGGSTICNLNKRQFSAIEVLIPSVESMQKFDKIVCPLFEAIHINQVENLRLVELRDTLLPRLMSGEIDVSNIQL